MCSRFQSWGLRLLGGILVLVLLGGIGANGIMADTVAFTSPGGLTTDVGAFDPVNCKTRLWSGPLLSP